MADRQSEITGEVSLRPARLALLVDGSDLSSIQDAIALLSATWGGFYNLLLDVNCDPAVARRQLEDHGIDAVVAVREEHSQNELVSLGDFRWRDVAQGGPFATPQDRYNLSALSIEWLLDNHEITNFVPVVGDPLRLLQAATFGSLESQNLEHFAAGAIRSMTQQVQILPGNVDGDLISLLDSTRIETGCDTRGQLRGFYLIDPSDGRALIDFWNIRAKGADIVAWPLGHDDPAILSYARAKIAQFEQATGEEAEELVIFPRGHEGEVPDDLLAATSLATRVADVMERNYRWRSRESQVVTRFSSLFTARLREDSTFEVPIPRMVSQYLQDGEAGNGIVFADLWLMNDTGLPPGRVARIPAVRANWQVTFWANSFTPHERGTRTGRTIGIGATSQTVSLYLVWSARIFSEILKNSEWSVDVSDNGQFAQYLMDSLGASYNEIANQPAVPSTLALVGRSRRGKTMGQILPHAEKYRGRWPDLLNRFGPKPEREYAKRVVYALLERRVLRPILPIRCPYCTNENVYSPEQLSSDLTCELCGRTFALGLALGAAGRSANEWYYRLAGNIDADQAAESLAIMATLQTVKTSVGGPTGSSEATVLGLRLKSKAHPCEIDVATFMSKGLGDAPVVVLGEVKSWRDELQADDLAKLSRVQDFLLAQGVPCHLMFSTYRDSLSDSEKELLWNYLVKARSAVIEEQQVPLLPIVFCGDDLKVQWHDDLHPAHWGGPGGTVHDLARESFRRNVGDFTYSATGDVVRIEVRQLDLEGQE